MNIDWYSNTNEILLNPRLPLEESQKWQRLLGCLHQSFEGHFWVSTSGSSGKSKWVAISKSSILVSARGVNQHLESHSKDCWIHVLPSFHVGGLGIWARSHLSGAQVIDLGSCWNKWDPRVFTQVAQESQASLSALVPTQIFDLVQASCVAPASFRAIVVGGGRLSESLYLKARQLGWPLLPSYGLTECGSQVATAELASLQKPERYPDLKLLPHVEAQSISQGLLKIRSEALLTGYAVENEEGLEFVDPKKDRWFLTEDLGSVVGDLLKIEGRIGSFLKMGGESVDFSRLEKIFDEVSLKCSIQGDLVLIAFPDERLGFCTHLVTTPQQELTEISRVVDSFNQRVLPIERIRKVHELKRIPRSALGKVLGSELIQILSS